MGGGGNEVSRKMRFELPFRPFLTTCVDRLGNSCVADADWENWLVQRNSGGAPVKSSKAGGKGSKNAAAPIRDEQGSIELL